MNTENSKTNASHKLVLNLSQRLDLWSSDKHVSLQNLFIYYTWKNVRQKYKSNKLKIIVPTWNDSVRYSGLYQVHYKKHETLTTNPLIHINTNRIKNGLVFRIKDGYKLKLQMPETKKFVSTKKLIDKSKNRENVPSREVVEIILVQSNLVWRIIYFYS